MSRTDVAPATAQLSVVAASAQPPAPPIGSVMWTGDSIAYDLAPAIGAALTSAGLVAGSNAYLGMRLVGDGQFALLPRLHDTLSDMNVDTVVVQLSLWDADHDAAAQHAAIDELHMLVVGNGSRLVFVSPPPTIDTARDGRLATMSDHARAIAAADPASTSFLDSTAIWGAAFDDDLDDDGTPERKRDGVHVCPSGAARFALWLTSELAFRFDGVAPTPPTDWATGSWVTDARYDEPIGSCAPLG